MDVTVGDGEGRGIAAVLVVLMFAHANLCVTQDWGPMSPRGGPLRTVISRVDVGLKPKGEGQWKLTIISAVVWVNECWELLLRNAHGPSIHAFV